MLIEAKFRSLLSFDNSQKKAPESIQVPFLRFSMGLYLFRHVNLVDTASRASLSVSVSYRDRAMAILNVCIVTQTNNVPISIYVCVSITRREIDTTRRITIVNISSCPA